MLKILGREFFFDGEKMIRKYFENGSRCYPDVELQSTIRNNKVGYILNGVYLTIEEIKKRQTNG